MDDFSVCCCFFCLSKNRRQWTRAILESHPTSSSSSWSVGNEIQFSKALYRILLILLLLREVVLPFASSRSLLGIHLLLIAVYFSSSTSADYTHKIRNYSSFVATINYETNKDLDSSSFRVEAKGNSLCQIKLAKWRRVMERRTWGCEEGVNLFYEVSKLVQIISYLWSSNSAPTLCGCYYAKTIIRGHFVSPTLMRSLLPQLVLDSQEPTTWQTVTRLGETLFHRFRPLLDGERDLFCHSARRRKDASELC